LLMRYYHALDSSPFCNRTTYLYVNCSMDVKQGEETVEFSYEVVSKGECHYYFSMASVAGCPVCRFPDDYQEILTECSGGVRHRKFERAPLGGRFCVGVPPDFPPIGCVPSGAYVGAGLSFFLLIFVISFVVLYIRHRRLYSQYRTLQQSDPTEMRRVSFSDTESERGGGAELRVQE